MVSEDYKIYIYKNSSALEETEEQAPQIDFGECYDKVKKYYNINQDLLVTLISNETDKSIYGKASNKYKFSSPETGKVLDTTGICNEKDKIIVQESIKTLMENIDDKKKEYINYLVNQGIDVFDLSNIFYNELCYYFESPNKKDVPLKDRYLSFYPNVTLCDRGCDIKGIDLDKKRAKCECSFNNFLNNDIVGNIKVGVLSDTFDILNSLNINVFKCFLDIFKPKNFIKCIGGFLFSACLIIQIICVVKFLSNGLYYIRKYIISLSESFNLYKSKTNIKNPPKRRQRSKTTKKNNFNKENLEINSQYSNNKILRNNLLDKERNMEKKSNTKIFKKLNLFDNSRQKTSKINFIHNNNTEEQKEYCNKINEYLNNSFDENDFGDVLDKENRSFNNYFCEKFKNNQIIINTFFIIDVFKPRTFKIILFTITIELYFVINALFYNEEYLSELFNSNEPEQFFSFVRRRIPEFVYTSAVSIIITYLIDFFSVEEEKIRRIFIRFRKDEIKLKYELILIFKTIKIRFISFFIFSLILSLVLIVYISCFNIVYPNIRIEWIKSSIFIFIVMQILNFILTFIECCLRYIAIYCNSEKLFKLSLLLN